MSLEARPAAGAGRRETVLLVHGTQIGPQAERERWYNPGALGQRPVRACPRAVSAARDTRPIPELAQSARPCPLRRPGLRRRRRLLLLCLHAPARVGGSP